MEYLIFQRYSNYYEHRDKYKLKLNPFPSFKFLYPVITKEANNLSYNFYNKKYGMPCGLQIKTQFDKYKFFTDAILMWQQAFTKKTPPMLVMKDKGDYIEILDTRGCAVASRHIIKGIYAEIIKLTTTYISRKEIAKNMKYLNGKKYTKKDMNTAIFVLKQKKILYEHNKWLLNLTISKKSKKKTPVFLPELV